VWLVSFTIEASRLRFRMPHSQWVRWLGVPLAFVIGFGIADAALHV
jgi:hypothetical protein